MEIFIDTAGRAEIERATRRGALDGCTTDPSLLGHAGRRIGHHPLAGVGLATFLRDAHSAPAALKGR